MEANLLCFCPLLIDFQVMELVLILLVPGACTSNVCLYFCSILAAFDCIAVGYWGKCLLF